VVRQAHHERLRLKKSWAEFKARQGM
jgi:hypothetical protein